MAEQRLIDANALREDWLENGENEYVYDTNSFLSSLDDAPTIDPENITVVRQLREELARVTAERDAAYSDFKLIEEECLCSVCDHQNEPDLFCADCKGSPYVATDTFKWRGQQKEE